MKLLLVAVDNFGVRKEFFKTEEDLLDDVCSEYFETSKDDKSMAKVIKELRDDGWWQDDYTTLVVIKLEEIIRAAGKSH